MLSVRDVLVALNGAKVRDVLIGGLASVLHGVPRTTTDIDLAVDADPGNVERALRALHRIGLVPDAESVDEILGQGRVTASDDLSADLLTALPPGPSARSGVDGPPFDSGEFVPPWCRGQTTFDS